MRQNLWGSRIADCILKDCTFEGDNIWTGPMVHGEAALSAERASVKGEYISDAIEVAVPSITDPDIAKVDVDVSAMTFAPAVGDSVEAIPLEALPTNARLLGAWVSAANTVQVTFGSEGGNVTGAGVDFKFVFKDRT